MLEHWAWKSGIEVLCPDYSNFWKPNSCKQIILLIPSHLPEVHKWPGLSCSLSTLMILFLYLSTILCLSIFSKLNLKMQRLLLPQLLLHDWTYEVCENRPFGFTDHSVNCRSAKVPRETGCWLSLHKLLDRAPTFSWLSMCGQDFLRRKFWK